MSRKKTLFAESAWCFFLWFDFGLRELRQKMESTVSDLPVVLPTKETSVCE